MSMGISGSGHAVDDAEMLDATSEDQDLALGKFLMSWNSFF